MRKDDNAETFNEGEDCKTNENRVETPIEDFHQMCKRHISKISFAHLNINSLRNKFVMLKPIFQSYIDVFLVSETKLDSSFTSAQFAIDGYHYPFRKDRNCNGGGLMLFINKSIICSEIPTPNLPGDIEALFIEINLRNQKILLVGTYKPPTQENPYFVEHIVKQISELKYDRVILMGDFNLEEENMHLDALKTDLNLENLIKQPTCFMSVSHPSCIDHIWVNEKKRFINSGVLESGLSDHHKMVFTFLNSQLPKSEPVIVNYRDYKNFDAAKFKSELKNTLTSSENITFEKFDTTLKNLVNLHAPLRQKCVRSNNAPFMNKRLRKEIMLRSRRKNVFQRDPTAENWNKYRLQRNKCTRMVRDAKRTFYATLDLKKLKDNKKFWKTIKPIFTEKAYTERLEKLVEGKDIIDNRQKVANVMNNYFANVTSSLDIHNIPTEACDENLDSIDTIISMYRNHPSILNIRRKLGNASQMDFDLTDRARVEKYVKGLKNKASPEGDIPVKILKQCADAYIDTLTTLICSSVNEGSFPDCLKLADVAPLHKTESRFMKENYRPVSKLPALSKVFERYMHDDINSFMADKLSPLLSGFRKGYSTQLSLLHMLDSWHRSLDAGNFVGAVLIDLSKAFDCINHNLLLAKMQAYGFSRKSLALVKSYLSNRKQRVTLNGVCSSWKDICIGVPQGSILGPLLFNIYINDLMFDFGDQTSVCNYADDNTIFASAKSLTEIKHKLESSLSSVSTWFANNGLQLNAKKCKLIVFGKSRTAHFSINVGNSLLEECAEVKLLGIKLDNKLSFAAHTRVLRSRANAKLQALQRIAKYLSLDKRKVLANSFISSALGYCPLIWSFSSRTSMQKCERINEKANALVADEFQTPNCTLHRKHCESLLKEVFKTRRGLNPSYMQEVFRERECEYKLRSGYSFVRPKTKTVKHGLQTASYIGVHLWDSLPENLKASSSLTKFCSSVSQIESLNCQCRLCATYVKNVGFI